MTVTQKDWRIFYPVMLDQPFWNLSHVIFGNLFVTTETNGMMDPQYEYELF